MRIGSLFSGIGGIEIGFEKAGYTAAWFVENNPYARKFADQELFIYKQKVKEIIIEETKYQYNLRKRLLGALGLK